MTGTQESTADDAGYVMRIVRERDIVRYFADLYVPDTCRPNILALHALSAEVGNIPASVDEPGLGEIRFQWWRDAVQQLEGPEYAAETPVMRAVALAVRAHDLPVNALTGLIDARRNDLYGDPMPTLRDLEGYFGETDSALFQLVCIVLGSRGAETADACGHAGIAYGLSTQLARLAEFRRRGRLVASSDLLEIYGLDAASMIAEKPPEISTDLIIHLVNLANGHLENARQAIRSLPARMQSAFLPLAIVPGILRRVRKNPTRLLDRPVTFSNLSILFRMFKAAAAGI